MAAVTSAVIAGLGAGASVYSAVQQNKLQKEAQKNAQAARNSINNIREQNPFAAVQVPTMGSEMALDEINQQASDSLQALRESGAAGVIGGSTNLNKSVRDANLDVAADLNDSKYRRDAMEAQAQSGINARKADRDLQIGLGDLAGSQQAASDAQYNKNQAITGAFSGLTGAVSGFGDMEQFDYMKDQRKAKKAGKTNETPKA